MPFATATLNKFLEAAHGKTTYTAPANVYVGYSTTTPTAAGANVTEPSGGSYARVATPGSSFGSAASGSITNSAEITFPTATASWGTVTYVVVFDASTAGNLLWFGAVTSQAVASGITPKLPVGSATSTLA